MENKVINLIILWFLNINHKFSIENLQCVGKFAVDLELCCREPPTVYPIIIPVHIRGHVTTSIQSQSLLSPSQQQQQQVTGTQSGASVTPSLAGGIAEEQIASIGKKASRARVPSAVQSGIFAGLIGAESDNRSNSVMGTSIFFIFL